MFCFFRFLRNPCKDEIYDLIIDDTETKVDDNLSKGLPNSKEDDENGSELEKELDGDNSELEDEENLPLPKFESTPAPKVQKKSEKKLEKHSNGSVVVTEKHVSFA